MNESCCLVLFTKPSVPGRVKTRLIGALSPEQAADLHGAFLADITERMKEGPFDFRIAWGVEGVDEVPDSPIPGFRQSEGTLGERLLHGLQLAGEQHSFVAAVGSDHPSVSAERICDAFGALGDQADIAIGPATDGGYYLIAAKTENLAEELFLEIPWSSPEVLAVTLQRCAGLRLRVHLLPTESDVDTPADLDWLCRELGSGGLTCPNTRALLVNWGKLSPSRSES